VTGDPISSVWKAVALRLIAGFGLLQIALLGLLAGPRLGDAWTLDDLKGLLLASRLQAGATLPPLLLYDARGPHRVHFDQQTCPTVLILSGCAPCNIERVKSWSKQVDLKQTRLIIIFDTTPDQLAAMREQWRLMGEIYANRGPGIYKLLGIEMLPVEVQAMRDGVVLAVHGPGA